MNEWLADRILDYRGSDLVIHATGTVFEPIEEGAYVQLVVKYGLIRIVSTKASLCDQVENVDLKCPIEKGVLSIIKSVEIPKEVPPVCFPLPLFSRFLSFNYEPSMQ